MKKVLCLAMAATAGASGFAIYPNVPTSDYTFVGTFGSACAVAITPFDIITAKHVTGMGNFNLPGFGSFTPIARTDHPDADVSVLRFGSALPGFHSPLYGDQVGQVVQLVGFGQTAVLRPDGTGYNMSGGAGIKRVASQRVSLRQSVNLGGGSPNSMSLFYDLDGNGVDTFADGGPVTGEGGIALGDSGGGWFRTIGSVHFLVGVNSFVTDLTFDFGDVGGAVDINHYRDWIVANTVPEPATVAALGLGLALLARRRRR